MLSEECHKLVIFGGECDSQVSVLDPGSENDVTEKRRANPSKMRISHRIEQVRNQKRRQWVHPVSHSSTLQRASGTRASDGRMCIQNAQLCQEE